MILIEQGEIGSPIPDLECGIFDPGRFELSGGPVHGGDYLGSRIVGRISRLKSSFEFFETISQLPAENIEVRMPRQCTTANPRTAPGTKRSDMPTMSVVKLESKMVFQARS